MYEIIRYKTGDEGEGTIIDEMPTRLAAFRMMQRSVDHCIDINTDQPKIIRSFDHITLIYKTCAITYSICQK